jgi:FNIP Repeat
LLFYYLNINDCLKLSLVCSGINVSIKSTLEKQCTFRYFLISFSQLLSYTDCIQRIPFGLKATTLTPRKVIVSSPISIPMNTTHLIWESSMYNNPSQLLVKHLPPTLTHLTTGDEFNQPVNNLPATLTHLTLGNDFNQPINFSLAHSLTSKWEIFSTK